MSTGGQAAEDAGGALDRGSPVLAPTGLHPAQRLNCGFLALLPLLPKINADQKRGLRLTRHNFCGALSLLSWQHCSVGRRTHVPKKSTVRS